MLATTDEKSLFPQTHRGHLSRIGGVRRRLAGAVHDGLESLSAFAGIRHIEAARKTALVPGLTPDRTNPLDRAIPAAHSSASADISWSICRCGSPAAAPPSGPLH